MEPEKRETGVGAAGNEKKKYPTEEDEMEWNFMCDNAVDVDSDDDEE